MRRALQLFLSLMLLSLSFSAFAGKCERIARKKERACSRKPDGKRCQRLTQKEQFCQGGSFDKSGWRGQRKCSRILRRMERACGRKPEGKRCQRLTSKAAQKGCSAGGAEQGYGYESDGYESGGY